MQQTGRITQVEPAGTWSNGQRTFNKFRVSFANGDILSFLAVNDFKHSAGETITYEKNPQHGTGKLVRDQNFNQQNNSKPQGKEDTQTYIIRQSMIKAAIDFHTGQPADLETIKNTARELIKFVHNG